MGDYEGIFIGLFGTGLEFTDTQNGDQPTIFEVPPRLMTKASKLVPGERIRLEVEFERYTVTKIKTRSSKEILVERIETLEKANVLLLEMMTELVAQTLPSEIQKKFQEMRDKT